MRKMVYLKIPFFITGVHVHAENTNAYDWNKRSSALSVSSMCLLQRIIFIMDFLSSLHPKNLGNCKAYMVQVKRFELLWFPGRF